MNDPGTWPRHGSLASPGVSSVAIAVTRPWVTACTGAKPALEHETDCGSIEVRCTVVCALPNVDPCRKKVTAPTARPGEVLVSRLDAKFDVDTVVMDPTRFFSRPSEVLADARLGLDQKRRILQSWALDAELMHEAEAENMGGRPGDRPYLREAKLALLALDR